MGSGLRVALLLWIFSGACAEAAGISGVATFSQTGAQPESNGIQAPRPGWVDRKGWREGATDYLVIRGAFWPTPQDALRDSYAKALRTLAELAGASGTTVLDEAFLQERLVEDWWLEESLRDYGVMRRAHVLLRIGHEERSALQKLILKHQRERRLSGLGLGGTAVLGAILVALGYRILDDYWRGYYRRELRLLGLLLYGCGLLAVLAFQFR
jgi:hypothetical protein